MSVWTGTDPRLVERTWKNLKDRKLMKEKLKMNEEIPIAK